MSDRFEHLGAYELRTKPDTVPVTIWGGEHHDSFLIPHCGDIVHWEHAGDDEIQETVVGSYSAYTVLAYEAEAAGLCPVTDVCDAVSDALHHASEAIYDDGAHFSKEHGLDDHWGGNILIVHHVKLDEGHRGRGLGLAVIHTLVRRYGADRELVVMKPFPLQFSHKVTQDNEGEFKAAVAKLTAYYKRLGFHPLRGAPEHLVLDLARGRPSLEKVLEA
ncbi:MAG: hypothetical protein JRD89_03545 [Deltaproteobacteria bacterium]|nr:hypothetical protein [Deltaproteobacteria bacterium]